MTKQADMFDLGGKVALVTGASRGIGQSIAEVLAAHNAHVIVSSRKQDECEKVASGIRQSGGSAEAMACHVGQLDAIQQLCGRIGAAHGHLDILVNNAAANPYYGHILDTPPEAYEKAVDVNIRGYFYMSIEAGKLMRAGGGGAIVNTASVNALRPAENQGIYSITKAAVVNMTKAFARECGPLGIRVNALLPGLTETRFAGAIFKDEELYARCIDEIPLRRHAQPQEMAGAVLYLVSAAGSYTNGACLVVDGGMTA